MALRDVTIDGLKPAIEEFRRIGFDAMLEKYSGRPSTRWYVKVGHRHFDQKLLLRAAHVHQGQGELTPQRFDARQARHHLQGLGYRVVEKCSATREDLAGPEATGPLMRWLIGAARRRTTMTYGEAAVRLERECGFGRIIQRDMGVAAGAVQYRIRERYTTAPLLHVLVVRGSGTRDEIGKPGDGAREFLALRFPEERLHSVRKRHPELWARVVAVATEEVYAYRHWEELYMDLHGDFFPDPFYEDPPQRGGLSRGGGGEGPNHEALRLWVQQHPQEIDRRFNGARSETEAELLSGDRVDVVYYAANQILAIEVKSRDSNWADLRRGLYQCIKYRAVLDAQEREGREVQSLLVTESRLPLDLKHLAKHHDVRHRQVPKDRR